MLLAQYWTVLSETCSVVFCCSFAAWALHKVYPFSQKSFIIQLKLCPFLLFSILCFSFSLCEIRTGFWIQFYLQCRFYILLFQCEFISCWPGPACIFLCSYPVFFLDPYSYTSHVGWGCWSFESAVLVKGYWTCSWGYGAVLDHCADLKLQWI